MPDSIRIRKLEGTWVVRAGDAVLAESRSALEMSDGESAPVVCFPEADVAMALLESEGTVECPRRGTLENYAIHTPAGVIDGAGHAFRAPPEQLARLGGTLAFDTKRVTVEEL